MTWYKVRPSTYASEIWEYWIEKDGSKWSVYYSGTHCENFRTLKACKAFADQCEAQARCQARPMMQ